MSTLRLVRAPSFGFGSEARGESPKEVAKPFIVPEQEIAKQERERLINRYRLKHSELSDENAIAAGALLGPFIGKLLMVDLGSNYDVMKARDAKKISIEAVQKIQDIPAINSFGAVAIRPVVREQSIYADRTTARLEETSTRIGKMLTRNGIVVETRKPQRVAFDKPECPLQKARNLAVASVPPATDEVQKPVVLLTFGVDYLPGAVAESKKIYEPDPFSGYFSRQEFGHVGISIASLAGLDSQNTPLFVDPLTSSN